MDTICHIITKLELGGAQEVALHVVSHLDPLKYRAVLISGPGGLLTEEAQRLPHIEMHLLPELGRRIHPLDDLVALVRMTKLLRRLRPSIVHTHSSKAGILGRWAAWLAGVPVILHTIHGFGITPNQPGWLRRLLTLLERLTGLITSHWIAVSQVDIAKGMAWRLFRSDQVSLIRPGIDPTLFLRPLNPQQRTALRAELGATQDQWLIGTVACLKPQKAPHDFVAVAKYVCAAIPQARFVLVGDGALRSQIDGLLNQEGLSDRVRLAGWRRDIPNVMQTLDAFLLTSHWEGLPRVLLEARAAGLPIVATRVGGAGEAVSHGTEAYLCAPGDCVSLAEKVIHILRRKPEQGKVMESHSHTFPNEFHVNEMVAQYSSLYEQFCGRFQARSTDRSAEVPL
ncbi:MAG: glycosyltransferase [Nitrospira sp.]|nr:glycosyltransferase [Nitrospira sp.]